MILTETKPLVLMEKYRSILLSAVTVELMTFAASLTDSIIAGNLIGLEALSAISLFSPFILVSSFGAAVINSGTLVNYMAETGRFNKERANEFFSQGMITAAAFGALLTALVFLIRPLFLSLVLSSPETGAFLARYYPITAFYLLLFPAGCLLNNIVIADGGEKLTAAANIVCIVVNASLSFVLAGRFGVAGIGAATVLGEIVFLLVLCLWFRSENNTLRFVICFSKKDLIRMISRGIARASRFIMSSLMLWILDFYILNRFDAGTFQVWTIVQNILGLSAVFLGTSMTLQPLTGPLLAENNTKAVRILVRRLILDTLVLSALCTLAVLFFTEPLLRVFGVRDAAILREGISAFRITGLTLSFSALTVLFFVYYFLLDRQALTFTMTLLSDLVCPAAAVLLPGMFLAADPSLLWICLAAGPVLSAFVCGLIVRIRYKRELFPLLLPRARDERIHIYAFEASAENASAISETAAALLSEEGYSERLRTLVSVCIEDLVNLICEQNRGAASRPASGRTASDRAASGRAASDRAESGRATSGRAASDRAASGRALAEFTLISEDDGVRVILRNDGKHFSITEESLAGCSFLKYTIDRMLTTTEHCSYIVTAGYNCSELFFRENI